MSDKRKPSETAEAPATKRARWDSDGPSPAANGSNGAAPAAASTDLAERAARLQVMRAKLAERLALSKGLSATTAPAAATAAAANAEAATRVAAAQRAALLSGGFARPVPGGLPAPQVKGYKPAPLRLDAEGREVDENGVPVVQKVTPVTSLKVNQRSQAELNRVKAPEPEPAAPQVDPLQFVDAELAVKGPRERKRREGFTFLQAGKLQREAEVMRLRAEFGDDALHQLRKREAQERRAAAEAASMKIDTNQIPLGQRVVAEKEPEIELEPIPDVEWWDARILSSGMYPDPAVFSDSEPYLGIKTELITSYVEHPVPIEPPAEAAAPPPRPLMLTKKEQRKLRKQRREEREKEKQELIRQGLLEAPEPKVKISNLMRVLGEEATADPTAIEQKVQEQMRERAQAHQDRNEARMLTPAERKEKKMAQLVGEAAPDTLVAIYKVGSLAVPQLKFKVDINATELHLTGVAAIADEFCIVIVEGGKKGLKKYKGLMLRRINWAEPPEVEGEQQQEDAPVNYCELVWEGSVQQPAFERFSVENCKTSAGARQMLAGRGVAHYWDLLQTQVQE